MSTQPHPQAPPDAPVNRSEFNALASQVRSLDKRCVRIETRLVRLLEHHGIDPSGQPLKKETS